MVAKGIRSTLGRVVEWGEPVVNRIDAINAFPYDPQTPLHLQQDRWQVIHHGVMIPNLPDPLRFFDIISVMGTSTSVPAFSVPSLVETTRRDSVWLLVGSAASRDNFGVLSKQNDCEFSADGTTLSYGKKLEIRQNGDEIAIEASVPGLTATLSLRPTPVITHFAHIPGLYDHWSRLCHYEGTFDTDSGEHLSTSGLCTWEYARGRDNVPLPILLFTYQIVNISDTVQVLFVELRGPLDLVMQRSVYIRELGVDGTVLLRRTVEHEVTESLAPYRTPDGVEMLLPKRFSWTGYDDSGVEIVSINGVSNDDFAYGMAAGFAGSYQYEGRFRGEDVTGRGYIEWIDRRK